MYSAVQDKSANYTVVAGDAGDLIRVTTTSGAVTITLPTISTVGDGFKVAIVKWTGDANAVNVVRSSTNTINGATSATIGSQYSSTIFVADFETDQWFAASSGLGATNIAVDAFSGNGSTTAFTLSGDPGSENNTQVYVSGVYQEKDTYSVSGTTLTFSTAPPTGTSNIEVVSSAPLAIGTPSDGTVTTAKLATLTPGVVISGSSSGDALRITQLGTGNALLVEDTTNPDSSPFVIDSSGVLIRGATASQTIFGSSVRNQFLGTGNEASNAIVGYANSTTGGGNGLILGRSRGATVGAEVILQSGDLINRISFVGSDGTALIESAHIESRVDGTPGTGDMPGRLVFSTTADGASTPTERMRIDSSGNLLVGTTTNSLSTKIFVSGSIGAQQTYGPMYISNENNTDNVGRATFSYRRGGTEVGFVSTTNTSTAYNTSSDYRLKENIAPMTGALANVARLKPVTYKWKSTGSDGEGFIAHELAEVCPHAVTNEKDAVDENGNPKYQAIDTSFLVATLTAAIQELKAINDTQAETINALTARVTALEGN
jgi:hypothetical protein